VGRFACAQAGCQDCLETLLRENKGLIQNVIQTQGMGGIDYADLVQEGRIGLWIATMHYDPARGYAFSTYTWTAIRYRLWRARLVDSGGGMALSALAGVGHLPFQVQAATLRVPPRTTPTALRAAPPFQVHPTPKERWQANRVQAEMGEENLLRNPEACLRQAEAENRAVFHKKHSCKCQVEVGGAWGGRQAGFEAG